MALLYILLAVIAYFLWRIYRQKEDEKDAVYNEKLDAEHEQERKEKFKDYPNLYGKLEGNWLEVFAHHAENNIPLLKLASMLYLQTAVKIDISEGEAKWGNLWDLTEELLEHLEKYHEGSVIEHQIAICTYWQIAAEAMDDLIENSPDKHINDSGKVYAPVDGDKINDKPYTNISNILSLFPKKNNHPDQEIKFTDDDGYFPRESKGSKLIHSRIDS